MEIVTEAAILNALQVAQLRIAVHIVWFIRTTHVNYIPPNGTQPMKSLPGNGMELQSTLKPIIGNIDVIKLIKMVTHEPNYK